MERVEFYNKSCINAYMKLKEIKKTDRAEFTEVSNTIDRLEMKILKLKYNKHVKAEEKIGLIKRFEKDLTVTSDRITVENDVDKLKESNLLKQLHVVISKDPSLKKMKAIDDLFIISGVEAKKFGKKVKKVESKVLGDIFFAQNSSGKAARKTKEKSRKKARKMEAKKVKKHEKLEKKKEKKMKAVMLKQGKLEDKKEKIQAKKGKKILKIRNLNKIRR